MLVRTIALLTSFCLGACIAATAQPAKETNMATTQSVELHKRTRADAIITLQNSVAKAFDRTPSPALMEVRLRETFTGDLNGESLVRALQAVRGDKSARLVSLQRFRGTLGGRRGTFVLQGSEIVRNGKIEATWFVVPGSGTGALSGLRGEGGFGGAFGKESKGALDYSFE